ncbi:MAG: histidinol-phosphate transaminase [Bacillota bacterium]|nr:histidinol-phosphate transaminase [Bacillota bacterium]
MVDNLFREDLKDYESYKVEDKGCKVVLDANESFLNFPEELHEQLSQTVKDILYNRYPDAYSSKVCDLYLKYIKDFYKVNININNQNIIAGNGSDELIQMIISAFASEGDNIAIPVPNFSMYKLYGQIAGAVPVEIPLEDDFKTDVNKLSEKVNALNAKVLFISNPNNPTGTIIDDEDLIRIIEKCNCIVVIDEAYGEFYGKTFIDKIMNYDNLIVLKTCSKMGLAAIRLGFLLANNKIMEEIKKVKPPYNVNTVTQEIGALVLKHTDIIKGNINKITAEREYVINELKSINNIKLYPTYSNFVLIEIDNAEKIYNDLIKNGISVRYFGKGQLKNCLRITFGNRTENNSLISRLKENLNK